MTRQRVRPTDVLGVPLLPPGGATAVGNRVRAAVGGVHGAMAPPPVRILEALFGILDYRVLVAICDVGVPDVLVGRMTIEELAAGTDSDPERLDRLVRFAATRGWLKIDRRGRVRPTRVTKFLRRGHPGGWRAWVDFLGGPEIVDAIAALSAGPPTDPFAAANGSPFFEWMAQHPDRWAAFDAAMAAGGRMHGLGLASVVEWADSSRVCDIGGGNGALVATILDRHEHLEGVVFDLPDVVARAVDRPRLTARGGDMFDAVPAGFDTYLLVNVVHDWADEDVTRILSNVVAASARGGRVVVVEHERTTVPRPDVATVSDLLMAAFTGGGQERTEEHLLGLAADAGLTHVRTERLPSGDLALQFRTGSCA